MMIHRAALSGRYDFREVRFGRCCPSGVLRVPQKSALQLIATAAIQASDGISAGNACRLHIQNATKAAHRGMPSKAG